MGFLDFLTKSKIGRILVFIFIFIFVFRTIDYVLQFFDVNIEMGYTFFIWITILFLLFALLPVQWSGYFLTKKENGDGGSVDAGGFGASSSSAAASKAGDFPGFHFSNTVPTDAGAGAASGGGGSGDGPVFTQSEGTRYDPSNQRVVYPNANHEYTGVKLLNNDKINKL